MKSAEASGGTPHPTGLDATLLADPAARRACALLQVDLDAAAWNYRRLCDQLTPGTECAAVVKANGYGLGIERMAPTFARAGARTFFVATIDEGLHLRRVLTETGWPDAAIHVLSGPLPGTERDLLDARLTPVLNSLGDLDRWRAAGKAAGVRPAAALHVDSGMSRLGLPDDEVDRLAADPSPLDEVALAHIMTHLSSADDPGHPENAAQLERFDAALARLPAAPVSFANSSGIFLGPDYHRNLARPGVALYGVNPTPGHPNPMQRVVTLKARILQVRQIDAQRGVGYGASFRAQGPTRIATIGVGYADGLLRHLSNSGHVAVQGRCAPVVGRVSMDSITVDVTEFGANAPVVGDFVDVIGDGHDQDALAEEAGTIGYEMLTALGSRYHRVYTGGGG
ncbi:alanine racemase [Rhodovibrio salinarum]|uniref:Alanine racemase n=1 Tax=Rhodovibrio salinarum TaxID=1087 RepID=A0A934QJQ4_9PROT|nr:alanine racemase [Rhodovibrio salinarum]MBK1698378.1 alanine racemase [Rhodovibrio salinarum]